MAAKLPQVTGDRAASGVAGAILKYLRRIPQSTQAKSRTPAKAARGMANAAAARAALAAGTLALPPGPLGWLTILPELVAVWKIQAQMVADIAAVYGKKAALSEEQMLYCLFRHSAAQAVRDLVVRVGERVLIRRASVEVIQAIARKVGLRLTRQAIGKGLTRWIPLAGALGVGAYAWYDTTQVAATAIALFEREIDVEPGP